MAAVWVDPPEDLLAERRQLGLDRFDEMWEGVLHMAPAPNYRHQDIVMAMGIALFPVAAEIGLKVLAGAGLYDPAVPGHESYRVPDVTVFPPATAAHRGVEGPASLVVEVRSRHDESFEKLPYYERLGVGEVLIVEPIYHRFRHWTNGPTGLVEAPMSNGIQIDLGCLPIRLLFEDDTLVVELLDADGSAIELVRV